MSPEIRPRDYIDIHYTDPPPFDVDSTFNEWNMSQPTEKMPENRDAFARVLHSVTRPFLAQGYNTIAALNRGTAGFFAHLDSVADFVEMSGAGSKGGIFEKLEEISTRNADHWKQRADEVGLNFLDELVSEAIGGFAPGVSQFSLDVASGLTLPYMAGAAEGAKRDESPLVAGLLEAAKTGTLAAVFRMMGPLKKYLQAPTMGTIFGVQEMEGAPEGQKARAFAKGAGIGAAYSLATPGGRLGITDIYENAKPMLESAKQFAETGGKVLASERGAIGEKKEPRNMTREEYWNSPTSNVYMKGKTQGEVVTDWLTRHKIPEENGMYVFYHGTPKKGGATTTLRSGSLLTNSPEEALHYAGRDRELKPQDLNVVEVRLYPQDLEPGVFPATRVDLSIKNNKAISELGKEVPTELDKKIVTPEAKLEGMKPKEGQTKPRKFIKTVKEASETAPEIIDLLDVVEPQDYYVQPNKESLQKAQRRIELEGLDKTVEYALSKEPVSAEKGATFITLMERFQKQGNFDKAVEMVEAYDMQLREAGRFVQAASLWNKLTPQAFLRWADKQIEKTKSKYSWADTLFGKKPEEFSLTREEKVDIAKKLAEINKMPEGADKTDATLQVIDTVAQKVPPSVSELIDAYRYQNMLSSPRTHYRNVGENVFNTFITRPIDITTRGGIDWVKSVLTGSDREAYTRDVAPYLKASINAVPNGVKAFIATMKLQKGTEIGKPEIGVEAKGEFERARAEQIPKILTMVPRFMEGCDKFNSALIGAGEFAIGKKRGLTDEQAYQRASELAEKYLYRDKLDPNDKSLSLFSKALSSLGKVADQSRKLPGIGTLSKWYIPFIKTPVNKAIQMVEHSPLGLVRSDFSQDALGKIMAGSIATAIGGIFALEGETTWSPPTDPKEKEWFYATGRKPYSIRIGDKWIPVWYLGPFALSFGLPAAVKHYTQDQKASMTQDAAEKLLAISEGIAQFIGNQTSTQSLGALFSAVQGDIDFRFSSQTGFTITQVLPGQSLIRYVNTIIDPVYRKPKGFWEGIEKDLPILSQRLDARMTPLLEESVREPQNYFLPYDVGTEKPVYESMFPFVKYEVRKKHLENKMDALTMKVRKGEISPEESMVELVKILEAVPKNMEQFVEETKE